MFPNLVEHTFMHQKITLNMYQKANEVENYDVEQVPYSDSKEFDFTRVPALKNTSENIDLVFLIRLMLEYRAKNTCYVNAMDKLWFTMVKNELLSLVGNLR
jgi:hypothetical protein